jgi:hypothetical protein
MLDSMKQYWNRLVAFAAALMTLFAGFVIAPPGAGGKNLWFNYGRFLVALLAGLWLLPMHSWTSRQYAWRWWAAAAVLAVASGMAVVHYNQLLDRWTVVYFQDQRVVIGQNYTDDAQKWRADELQAGRPLDDLRLLKSYAGDAAAVWEDVLERQEKLSLWYLAVVLLLASAVITVAQAGYCANSRSKARRKAV